MSVAARLLLALAVGLALTVAAGCGNSSGEARETTVATTVTAETETEPGTAAEAAPGAETSGEKATGKPAGAARGGTTEQTGTTSQGASTSRTRPRIVRAVDRVLFRIPRNAVVCGRKGSSLVCWRPVSGFTVRLGRGDSPPTQGFIAANRGLPPAVRSLPVLRRGRPVRSGTFACVLRATNAVRCRNGARHGFELGKLVSFRF